MSSKKYLPKLSTIIVMVGLFFLLQSINVLAAANDNIVNYWAHNQTAGTTVIDIYNRDNLTITSAVWNNNVINFSGSSAARAVTASSYAGGTIKAICFAMYPSNAWTSGTGYLMKVTGGTEVYVNNAAHLTLTDGTGTLATTQTNTITSQSSDIYTHVCLNFNGTQTEIWVNGTNQTLSSSDYPYYNLSGAGNALWTIGNYNNNAFAFHGSIKEIATFNKPLTSSQIALIYNNGSFANLGNDSTPAVVSNITTNIIAKNITSGSTINSFTVYYVNSTGGTTVGVNTTTGLVTLNLSPNYIYNFTIANATGYNTSFLALNITNTSSNYSNGNYSLNVSLNYNSTVIATQNVTVNVVARNASNSALINSFTVYYVNASGGSTIGVNTTTGLASFNVTANTTYNFTITNATGFNSTFLALNITGSSSNFSGGNYSINVSLVSNASTNVTPTPTVSGSGIIMKLTSDWQYTNASGRYWADITFNGTYYNVQTVNITIYNDSLNTIVSNGTMTKKQTGQYYYNITPNVSGQYHAYAVASNGTDIIASDAVTITVIDNIPTKTTEAFDMILSTFLLFSIGMLFLVVGYYVKIDELFLAGGIWFIANTIQLIANTGLSALTSASSLFFAILGLLIIYYYIDLKIKYWFSSKQEKKNIEYE